MVYRDAVRELGLLRVAEPVGALLDEPQAEMDVPEQPALVGRQEGGASSELERSPDVVEDGRCEHELGPEARVELRCLAAQRRDPDRVLEETAGVGVVVAGGRRPGFEVPVCEHRSHRRGKAGMGDLLDEKVEKPLQLRAVAPERRGKARRIDLGRLERPDVELEPIAELLDPADHPHRVALGQAAVEELDVATPARRSVRSGRRASIAR